VLVHAGFTPEQIEASRAAMLARIPLGRVAQPDEIAWWIVQVARPNAAYVSGAVLRVDGGINVA
jgi:NAD(P)-dependent dehydrogenase (short-subunit alcohol dehydrogenase family)